MDPEKNHYQKISQWNQPARSKEGCLVKGPIRLMRLCLLVMLLPGLLIAIPLYLRYHVYSEHLVPLSMSDMRVIDNKISTTWCQAQKVTSNVTFNAYLLPERPTVQMTPKFVNLVREMQLDDDMKEYWGFYLLQGSTVTVSSCARRHGASLIVIRGHHHLRQCAYIGDDSSEEEEELEEIRNQIPVKSLEITKMPPPPSTSTVLNEANKRFSNRQRLQKVRTGVKFTGTESGTKPVDEKMIISKELDLGDKVDEFNMKLFEEHRAKTRANKIPGSPLAESNLPKSEEVFKAAVSKFRDYKSQGKDVVDELRKSMGDEGLDWLKTLLKGNTSEQEARKRRHQAIADELNIQDDADNDAKEQGVPLYEHKEIHGSVNGTSANDTSNSEFWSSFSSSEERLLECEGLILSQPLGPSGLCDPTATAEQLRTAALRQRITYTVPGNGYYFFVFSSENEVERNFIHAELDLEKKQYDVRNAVASCRNSTGSCQLPLGFFSHDRLVLELPTPANDSLWDAEFLIVSTCQPRTALYVACIVAVPVLILLFSY